MNAPLFALTVVAAVLAGGSAILGCFLLLLVF